MFCSESDSPRFISRRRLSITLPAFETLSASPSILSSLSRQVMRTPNSFSIIFIFSSKLPKRVTALSILSIFRICSVRQNSCFYKFNKTIIPQIQKKNSQKIVFFTKILNFVKCDENASYKNVLFVIFIVSSS